MNAVALAEPNQPMPSVSTADASEDAHDAAGASFPLAPASDAQRRTAPPLCADEWLLPGYRVVAHLRRGNDLDTYDVWSEARRCRCVAKTLRPERLDHKRCREALITEGRLLERFSHPHIVRAYETLDLPFPAIIMETLPGATLEHLIDARVELGRRLTVADVVVLGTHLCSAMHYVHRQGVLHLDLKPSNVVAKCGVAKVLDFSIARPPGPGRRGAGTRQYMAPEQARGDVLTVATDVWGIGGVLFEAITGNTPFDAYHGQERYEQLERRAEPVRALRRVPVALAKLVAACLEPEPGDRPSVDAVARGLEALA